MKKFLFSLAILLIVFLPSLASAAEGDCHLKNCLVPAPTVYQPDMNETTSRRPIITGLTWKTTVVKVYLDGQELANVKQIKHDDYYGSFWVQPDFDLEPGQHYVYTIAHSEKPGWYDQSQESKYIYFTVPEPVIARASAKNIALPVTYPPTEPVEPAVDNNMPVLTDNEQIDDNGEIKVINEQAEGAVNVEENLGQIEGGVSELADNKDDNLNNLQDAATVDEIDSDLTGQFDDESLEDISKRNRVLGFIILALLLLGGVAWYFVQRSRQSAGINEKNISSDSDTDTSSISSSDESKAGSKEYWGSPGDDTHSYQDKKDE